MKNGLRIKKYHVGLRPGLLSLLAGILTFLVLQGNLIAADLDDRIESAARKSYIFKTFLT